VAAGASHHPGVALVPQQLLINHSRDHSSVALVPRQLLIHQWIRDYQTL
jgi:hypothetical protein